MSVELSTHRAAFEAVISQRRYGALLRCRDKAGNDLDEYASAQVQLDWLLWQAAIASQSPQSNCPGVTV